jgi:prepilin-type N-terminal cleavage/methylation domain-containing protein
MNRRAFTLLESVFAVAIFAIALGFLAASFQQVLFATDRVRLEDPIGIEERLVRSAVLALETIAEIEAGGEVELPGGERLNWRGRIEPGPLLNTVRLDVEIMSSFGNGGDESFSLYLYRPALIEPSDRETMFFDREREIRQGRPERFNQLQGGPR